MKFYLSSKIHRAKITEADLNYIGSITIASDLMEKTGIEEGEKVLVVDLDNGARLETYVIKGEKGEIKINGAAAHLMKKGDKVIIISFVLADKPPKPKIILVNEKNEFVRYIK